MRGGRLGGLLGLVLCGHWAPPRECRSVLAAALLVAQLAQLGKFVAQGRLL